jgi:hypothetical protein
MQMSDRKGQAFLNRDIGDPVIGILINDNDFGILESLSFQTIPHPFDLLGSPEYCYDERFYAGGG